MRRFRFVAAVFAVVSLLALSGVAIGDSWASNSSDVSPAVALRGAQIDLPFEGEFDSPNEPPIYTMAGLEGRANLWGPNPTVGNLRGKLSIGGGPENAWRFSVFPIGPIEDKQYEDPGFEDCLGGLTPPEVEFFAGLDRLVFLNIVSRALRGTGALDWHREVVCSNGEVHEHDTWGLNGALVSSRQTGFLILRSPGLPIEADLAITHFEVVASPEVPVNTPFEIEVFEEVTNFGPDGPTLGAVAQFLFPPNDCQTDFAITPDLLAFAGGTVSIQHDGVFTDYTAPTVVHGPPGTEHIGPIFTIPIDVGEVIPITESWTVECANPSSHRFRVEKFFNPIDVRDPDLGNNELFTVVDVAIIGNADIEVVSVEFGDVPQFVGIDETIDFPATEIIRNNGPDGPVEVEVQANLHAQGFTPTIVVTPELLELAGGELGVALRFADGTFDGFPVSEPSEFTAGPGGVAGFNFVIRIGADEQVVIPELWRVTITEPEMFTVRLDKSTFGFHVVDPDEGNNFGFVEAPLGVFIPSEADLAILAFEAFAPGEVPINEQFEVTTFEEITNFGPDGPVRGIVNQFLFPPSDCQASFVVTEELLALAAGPVVVQLDGVLTEYTTPTVVHAPRGAEHIGPIFVLNLGVGQVVGVGELWTVECESTSQHDFRIEKFVQPDDVFDPDMTNNEQGAHFGLPVFGVTDAEVVSLFPDFIDGPFDPGIPFEVPVAAVFANNGPDSPVEANPQINLFVPTGLVSVEITQDLLDLSRGLVTVVVHLPDGSNQFIEIDTPTVWHGAPEENIGVILNLRLEAGAPVPVDIPFMVELLEPGDPFVSVAASINTVHAEDTDRGNNLIVHEFVGGEPRLIGIGVVVN